MRFLSATVAIAAMTCSSLALADSWRFEPRRKVEQRKFGDVTIETVVDGRKDRQNPEFLLRLLDKGHLKLQVRDVAFENIAASPDGKLFVGLSNRGIPGSAIIIFSRDGAVSHLVRHGTRRV